MKGECAFMVDNMKPKKNIPKKKKYTAEEFFEFTKDKEDRYELIDGRIYRMGDIYMMSSPAVKHQRIIREIGSELRNYLKGKKCEIFMAPLDVVLFKKDKEKSQNVFQPDIFVVCDPKKISKERIYGAPDFIVEVISASNPENDCVYKLNVYMQYGVKEYWIVNPDTNNILVYIKDEDKIRFHIYTFSDKIKVGIFDGFEIDFKELQI